MKMLLLFSPFALVEEGLISLLMLIDAKIYGLFAKLYSLYLDLAMARIFDISTFDNVIKNVYVIFGVVALFIVVFSLLQAMVNPEDVSKGTKTTKDVIKRLILCVGLTCVVPFAFDFLYDFQFSLLKFQVIPKTMIGIQGSDNISYSEEYTDGEGNQGTISGQINASDFTKSGLQVYGNQMAFYVLNGFFFANDLDSDGTPDEVIVEASEHFGSDNGLVGGAIGCIGGVVITGILALTGVGIPAAATTGAGTAAICAGGVVAGVVIDGALETITAEEFSWRAVSQNLIPYFGEFDLIAPFSEAVVNGTMSYTPIISTIAGIIMLYMMFSFCLDLGVRAAKLVFYQIMAPISFLLSILPKNKDLMSTWFKAVLSTWAEVFVRIICVCGAALLISNLNFDELSNFGLIARAIIVLGIVAFAKQAPKLFGEITGIKSANIKLGIRDKLKEGGLFAAGSAAGALITSHGNPLAAMRAGKAGWKNGDFKAIGGEAKRRQAYKDALDSGATRRQMALNTLRGAFGFDSTAEAAERKIKTGATNVENNSPNSIVYTDGSGITHTILSGANAQIDDVTAEELKAKKTQNIGAMSDANDKMRDLDKKIKWASSQKAWKSAMDDEADKKFNDGKYEHSIRYMDSSGAIHEEKVNGKRLSELSQQGMKFLYADSNRDTYTMTYTDQNGETKVLKGKKQSQIDEILSRTGGTLVSQQRESVTEKKIRDEVRATFSTQELTSDSPNLIKNKTEAFFTTLDNEGGFSYQSYVYDKDTGQQKYKDGKAVIETGGFTSKIDENNNRIITHTSVDSDGVEHKTVYTSIGKGMLEYIDDKGNRQEMSVYDLSDMFDQKSKSTSGVLEAQKQGIAEGEDFIRARNENDAIDALLKQRDEKIAESLQSQKQRGREAAKKYTANRK